MDVDWFIYSTALQYCLDHDGQLVDCVCVLQAAVLGLWVGGWVGGWTKHRV
jgi:hypothetical protein